MISVTILVTKSTPLLNQIIEKLAPLGQVILLCNGGTKVTHPNATSYLSPFIGFGPLHNLAASHASHDWILSIDSDELPSDALIAELSSLALDPSCVYSIKRDNYYRGQHIKWCGWSPDRVLRLYHRKATSFSNDQVHERVLSKNLRIIPLQSPLKHYSYHTASDFLAKMQSYSTLFAAQNPDKKVTHGTAIRHALAAFFKAYILKRGLLGGSLGLQISLYNAQTTYYKYLKILESK